MHTVKQSAQRDRPVRMVVLRWFRERVGAITVSPGSGYFDLSEGTSVKIQYVPVPRKAVHLMITFKVIYIFSMFS
jgi:hypothetical protein